MAQIALVVEDRLKWDQFIETGTSFGLLQSWQWGEFKIKMGWKVYRVAVEENGTFTAAAQLLVKPLLGRLASIAYIPRGPITDWSDEGSATILLEKIHQVARAEHAIFLKIEPPLLDSAANHTLVRKYHFKQSQITNQPRNTIVVDISLEPEELLAQMRKKTRQYIRRADKEGISVRAGDKNDLQEFIQTMELTGRRVGFPSRSRRYYQLEHETFNTEDHFTLLLAEKDGKLLAVRTIYAFGRHAAEFHAGSADFSDNLHPNYLLVWEGLQWAKAKGCISYDMWGIPDEIRNGHSDDSGNDNGDGNGIDDPAILERRDGLWGVYRFKRGFSSNVVSYIGAYDFIYAPIPYLFYATRFLNRDSVEKIAIWTESMRKNRRT